MQALLTWFLKLILDMLLKKATTAASEAKAKHDKAVERGKVNKENLEKYEKAKTRAEEIQAATDLLNGTRSRK